MFSIIQAAGWPIWPLLACSVVTLAIVIERFLSLQEAKIAPRRLLAEVLSVCKSGIPPPAVLSQLERNCALGEILAHGLRQAASHPGSSPEELRAGFEGAGRQVAQRLERYLPALATIASVAPLLGLLGTVVGMIEIFGAQSSTGATAGTNPMQLAHGISVALYNTAFGLIVAIPSLIFWRYFRARVDAYLLSMELASAQLARHIDSLKTSAANASGH